MLNDHGQLVINNATPPVKPLWKAKPKSGMPDEAMLAKLMGNERKRIEAEERKRNARYRLTIEKPPLPEIPAKDRPKAILKLMADGRERTAEDIANRIGGTGEQMTRALTRLHDYGDIERIWVKGIAAWKIAE